MISFSSVRPYEKATLPSVEMWNTNMNIIRDPPKGVFTRRKDRVGDTQQILLQQDDAGSRVNEFINVYARNVNPMVGVSHNNYGNTQQGGRKSQASLPYKIDVVRPPILSPYDLQPLSRLPRTWFYASTNPEFPGIVQNSQCNEVGKSIENYNLRSQLNVRPNKSMLANLSTESFASNVEADRVRNRTPLQGHFQSNVGTSAINVASMQAPKDLRSVRTTSLLSKDVQTAKKGLSTASSSLMRFGSQRKLYTPKYRSTKLSRMSNTSSLPGRTTLSSQHLSYPISKRQPITNIDTRKTLSQPKQHTPTYQFVPKIPHHSMQSNQSSYTQTLREEHVRTLDRKLPMAENVSTKKLYNFETLDAGMPSRQKNLLDRLSTYGSFANPGTAIPNPHGVQDKNISTSAIAIDDAKPALRQKMQEYFRV